VENISIVPIAKQAIGERKQMDTFDQQLATDLCKIWPEKPLEPGEYAMVELSNAEEQDEVQLMLWDFAIAENAQISEDALMKGA
jgi:hypothetical protein